MNRHQINYSGPIPSSGHFQTGKFGRLFPHLAPWTYTGKLSPEQYLTALAEKMIRLDKDQPPANSLPAGYTYLGQFISHDISFDTTSVSERISDPDYLWSFRTPALDLDSIYGGGPNLIPYIYDAAKEQFVLTKTESTTKDKTEFWDIQRSKNKVPILPDPRNGEHLIIRQLNVAFMLLHNTVVQLIPKKHDGHNRFLEAKRLTTWYYQYVILNDYLPTILGRKFSRASSWSGFKDNHFNNLNFIPVEFSAAVFRFGHSLVKRTYIFSPQFDQNFELSLDMDENPEEKFYVDWSFFFGKKISNWDERPVVKNTAHVIAPMFVESLVKLPDGSNLIAADLLKGLKFNLPSGQSVANALGFPHLNWEYFKSLFPEESFFRFSDEEIKELQENTPLFYYILAEAAMQRKGESLGLVGGYIIEQTIVGLLLADKNSYLNQHPNWIPKDKDGNEKPDFTMADLLDLAGVPKGAIIKEKS